MNNLEFYRDYKSVSRANAALNLSKYMSYNVLVRELAKESSSHAAKIYMMDWKFVKGLKTYAEISQRYFVSLSHNCQTTNVRKGGVHC